MKITTDEGLIGYGDGTLNGRELAVVAYLKDHVAPLLMGGDPHRIEDTWQFLYRSAYWRRGPVTMASIAAVDMALWDIKAQAAGMPLYQLLGGASAPESVLTAMRLAATLRRSSSQFGSTGGGLQGHSRADVRPRHQRRLWCGIAAYVGGVRYDYEPAQRAPLPAEEDWDSRAYLRHVASVFEAIRNEFGPELPLLHDAHHRLTPIQAAKLGKSLEPYDLFWLEDPTPTENQEALRLIRHHTTTPIATGEIFNTIWDYQHLIKEQLFDYVRSAVTHAGGITPMKKIMDYAAQYQIKSGFHGPTDVSPVGMAAALHLDLAIHNFGIQEYMPHGPLTNEVFEQSFTFKDGDLHPGEKPGLGVTVNEKEAAKYPYARCLPAVYPTEGRNGARLVTAQHVVVMGVSGSGKSTVGELLAQELDATFIDSDVLHPEANVAKMAAGTPLNDADRKPWLEAIGQKLADAGDESLVIACSALKKSYRNIIRAADPTARFVHLDGPRELLSKRVTTRRGHFMPPSLLQSQLETLERLDSDESGVVLDISERPDELARKAAALLTAG